MIKSSVTGEEYVPLGQQRLHTMELVLRMVQFRKDELYTALGNSQAFPYIMELVKKYPWNNFMQLKVISLVDEIFDYCENVEFKTKFMNVSGIGNALVNMSEQAEFEMASGRKIRNGFMGLVVNVSNKLQKKYTKTETTNEDPAVVEYLDSVGEEWKAFVDGELKTSNEDNNKTLGGTTRTPDEDEDNTYDVQMEKIMARFTNFNQILTNQSPPDDDDDDDCDEEDTQSNETEETNEEESDDSKKTPQDSLTSNDGLKIQQVDLKEPEPLEADFVDNNYWNVNKDDEIDYDSLYAELEA